MRFNITNMSRDEVKSMAFDKIYGSLPKKPLHLDIDPIMEDDGFAAGRATYRKDFLIVETEEAVIKIPFVSVIPQSSKPIPAIISLNFERNVPNKFLPAEEIADRGYALFSLSIDDISTNDANYKTGVYRQLVKSRKKNNSPGKIAVWAYVASVLCDHIYTLSAIDKSKIGISGHHTCALAAMLATGIDEKINFVIANNALAAFSPMANLENIGSVMAYDHPYLFCPTFAEDPLNQCPLVMMELCKGKKLLIGCAEDDMRSNYQTEYEILRKTRFYEIGDQLPCLAEKSHTRPLIFENDDTSFHLRSGRSYFGRDDWNIYLDFLDKKL